jgi:transposase InsO family protein
MPWREVSSMECREEFVMLARSDGSNVRELCQRFGVSPTTGYKWLSRYRDLGRIGLLEVSRRPHASPGRTAAALEDRIVQLRDQHPAWGGRKLRRRLQVLGEPVVPSASTITQILRRHGRLDDGEAVKHRAFVRFERAQPNDLWQMDFKGHFALGAGRCHPLSVLDDHSRFAVGLEACADERGLTVQGRLCAIFRRYGLPWRLLVDNGAPWGDAADNPHTQLTTWLLRLEVGVSHGRPYHPQTQGKAERFHRSLADEVLTGRPPADLVDCQRRFDAWRHVYNTERPHQALGMTVPLARYSPSPRPFPEVLPTIEYDSTHDAVRRVDRNGHISWRGRYYHIGRAFQGHPVALRPTVQDGCFEVLFCRHPITTIDLTDKP